jgi:hypothetical protein
VAAKSRTEPVIEVAHTAQIPDRSSEENMMLIPDRRVFRRRVPAQACAEKARLFQEFNDAIGKFRLAQEELRDALVVPAGDSDWISLEAELENYFRRCSAIEALQENCNIAEAALVKHLRLHKCSL